MKLFLKILQYSQENTCVEKRLQHRCFPVHISKFLRTLILKKHMRTAASDYSFTLVIYLLSAVSLQAKKNYDPSWWRKRLLKLDYVIQWHMTYVFKGHVKIIKIYMVKFNVSILNRLKIMVFLVNAKYKNKHNVIFNESITKLVTILTKCFFPYLHIWTLQATLGSSRG